MEKGTGLEKGEAVSEAMGCQEKDGWGIVTVSLCPAIIYPWFWKDGTIAGKRQGWPPPALNNSLDSTASLETEKGFCPLIGILWRVASHWRVHNTSAREQNTSAREMDSSLQPPSANEKTGLVLGSGGEAPGTGLFSSPTSYLAVGCAHSRSGGNEGVCAQGCGEPL